MSQNEQSEEEYVYQIYNEVDKALREQILELNNLQAFCLIYVTSDGEPGLTSHAESADVGFVLHAALHRAAFALNNELFADDQDDPDE